MSLPGALLPKDHMYSLSETEHNALQEFLAKDYNWINLSVHLSSVGSWPACQDV